MKAFYILALSIFLCSGCASFMTEMSFIPPYDMNDEPGTLYLDDVNIDSRIIFKASAGIPDQKYKEIHSMQTYKDRKLVVEAYRKGQNFKWPSTGYCCEQDDWIHGIQSTKFSVSTSLTSICIGIALDKGFINSVDQSIFDYLPNHQHLRTKEKEKITIGHLLTMTAGLEWEEWEISPGKSVNDAIAIGYYEEGPVNYVLGKPMVHEPGTHFNYSGGDIQILAEILKNASGMTLDKFSEKYLLEPLWIKSNDSWLVFPNGEIQAAEGLTLLPGDMAKIEKLILNRGTFNGDRIVSGKWIEKHLTVTSSPGGPHNASLF